MKALEQRRPTVRVMRSTNMGIPRRGAIKPMPAPYASFLAISGGKLITSLAVDLGSLATPPGHTQQYCNHLALQSIQLSCKLSLRWPARAPIAEKGQAGSVEKADFYRERRTFQRQVSTVSPEYLPHAALHVCVKHLRMPASLLKVCPRHGKDSTTGHFPGLGGSSRHPLHGKTDREESLIWWPHFS